MGNGNNGGEEKERTRHVFVECAAGRFFLRLTFSTVSKKKKEKKNSTRNERLLRRTNQGFFHQEGGGGEGGGGGGIEAIVEEDIKPSCALGMSRKATKFGDFPRLPWEGEGGRKEVRFSRERARHHCE